MKSIKGTDKPFDHFDWNLDFPEILNPIINNVNKGFDLVIGNPPYVEHKKLKSIAYLLKSRYDVYTGSSDLSVYFFEKGFELLKEGSGVLTYINTNKFFSTGYGKELRKYLLSKNIKSLINFEQVEIFEGILVSSTIISAQNCISNPESEFLYLGYEKNNNWIDGFEKDLKARNCFPLSILDDSEWSFQTGVGVEIKRKVEDNGTPLKLINGLDIKRGVTTGYDPAFIIDNSLSEQFEPDIIKPLLKGRSIKKYLNLPSNLMLIFTRTGIDISLYAKTESYLQEFKEDLQPRTSKGERGRKPGSYKWFEIQDNTAYYKLFDQVKIIWPLTADKWGFTIDKDGHYLTSGGFLLVSEVVSLTYILAFLNSSLMRYYFGFVGVMTAGGAYTLKKATIENFPIIIPENDSVLEPIVNEILSLKRDTIDTTELEQKIDQFFFKLYELNFEEVIEIIPNFWLTEEEYTNFSLEDLEV
ncbi:MAG: TaqI-like C-terminal specificity domain-containing protein [Cyclobacteriaceae bacterium]